METGGDGKAYINQNNFGNRGISFYFGWNSIEIGFEVPSGEILRVRLYLDYWVAIRTWIHFCISFTDLSCFIVSWAFFLLQKPEMLPASISRAIRSQKREVGNRRQEAEFKSHLTQCRRFKLPKSAAILRDIWISLRTGNKEIRFLKNLPGQMRRYPFQIVRCGRVANMLLMCMEANKSGMFTTTS